MPNLQKNKISYDDIISKIFEFEEDEINNNDINHK